MAEVKVVSPELDIEGSTLVEGLPGTGLVAKIAADYLIESRDMKLYAEIYSEDTPGVAVFGKDDSELKAPIRVYADPEYDLAVLKSDEPVPSSAETFMETVTDWIEEEHLRPMLQSGLPIKSEGDKKLFLTVTGEPDTNGVDLPKPSIDGGIGGPTGALIETMIRKDIDGMCLVAESDPNFPDPRASRLLIEKGIEPLSGIDIDTEELQQKADKIKKRKKQVAQQLQESEEDKSSEAFPREMYH